MRTNVLAMPFVNALHVLCITLVFGTILIVDLRLLGLLDRGARSRSYRARDAAADLGRVRSAPW